MLRLTWQLLQMSLPFAFRKLPRRFFLPVQGHSRIAPYLHAILVRDLSAIVGALDDA